MKNCKRSLEIKSRVQRSASLLLDERRDPLPRVLSVLHVKLTTHPQLVPMFAMYGAIPLHPDTTFVMVINLKAGTSLN
jgi:hypothetical protein